MQTEQLRTRTSRSFRPLYLLIGLGGLLISGSCTSLTEPKVALPASLEIVSGHGAAVPVATTHTITVRVVDNAGRLVVGASVTWAVTAGDGTIAGGGASGENGLASSTWTLGPIAGAQSATASVQGVPAANFTVTAVAGPPAQLRRIVGDSAQAAVGSAISLVTEVVDVHGNLIEGANVAWAVVSGAGAIDPATAVTGANGRATAIWTLGSGAGQQQASAAVTGAGATIFTGTATAGSPAELRRILGDSVQAVAGSSIDLVTEVVDAHGNVIAGAVVAWAVMSGAGSIAPASSVTGADGRANASWTLGPAAGQQQATATVAGADSAVFTATATVAIASISVVSGDGGYSAFGATRTLVVEVEDIAGQPVEGAVIAWATSAGTVAASSATTDGTGRASMTWTIGAVEAAQTVQASIPTAAHVDAAVFTVNGVNPVISANITVDRIIRLIEVPYSVTQVVSASAHVTIEPGVVLSFAANAGLSITATGSLVAAGTPASRIVLRGSVETPGHWRGLIVYSSDARNALDHVTIADGGGTRYSGTFTEANLYVASSGYIRATNSGFVRSNESGIAAENGASLAGFAGNHFVANVREGMSIPTNLIGALDAGTDYSNTDGGHARVDAFGSAVATNQEWPSINVPYRMRGTSTVGGALVVAPGARFSFGPAAGLSIEATGSMSAVGTASDTIVFTGEAASPGYWMGIIFYSNSPANALSYARVEFGGGTRYPGTFTEANVYVDGSARVALSRSTFRLAPKYGLAVEEAGGLPGFSANTFIGNGVAGLSIPARLAGSIDAASDYTNPGDGTAHIHVRASTVAVAQTWPATNAPYRFSGISVISGDLTIAAGASFAFNAAAGIQVSATGSFVAIGTIAAPLSFTGEAASPGYWMGIIIESNDPRNELTHATVAHGGGVRYAATDTEANLYVRSNSRIRVTNSTFRESSNEGLYVESAGHLPEFADNVFLANTSEGLRIPARLVGSLDTGSNYLNTGDGPGRVSVYGTVVSSNQTWPAIDAPYYFAGTTSIDADITIAAGSVLSFNTGAGIQVRAVGSLRAIGTASDSIVFTGGAAAPGYWRGIIIESNNPLNQMAFVRIGHGGGTRYSGTATEANIYVRSSSRLTLSSSHIHDSAQWGVYAENGSTYVGSDLTFNNNATGNERPPG